eukprot:761918-Hanusia_phi.AAC.1
MGRADLRIAKASCDFCRAFWWFPLRYLSASCRISVWKVPSLLALGLRHMAAQAADENAAATAVAANKTQEQRAQEYKEQVNAVRVLYAAQVTGQEQHRAFAMLMPSQHAVKTANESCGTPPCGGDPAERKGSGEGSRGLIIPFSVCCQPCEHHVR